MKTPFCLIQLYVKIRRLAARVKGRAYPAKDLAQTQAVHGRRGALIDVQWTTPDHWAHNNYEQGHLPQLCVRASGWKARLIALILWPKLPWSWEMDLPPGVSQRLHEEA